MPICYVMGGLGESVLSRSAEGGGVVWIDPGVILLGKILEMTLAPNGIDPGPPDGVALFPSGVVGPYLGFPATILGAQLATSGYSTRSHSWDWRKQIYPAGATLAGRIRAEVTPADPCAIVAHSAGGLVARAAWTELGITGEQGLVRRIVTLGTPHWGSYTIVDFWSGSNQSIDILTYWNQTVGYNTAGYAPSITGYRFVTVLEIQRMALTWPGFYDVLPVLGSPDATEDPHRALLYDASSWPATARPSQAWLDWSRDHTGPWLRSAASMPPPDVLTCISGSTSSVATALVSPQFLGQSRALGNYQTGDGAVARVSAELTGAALVHVVVNHENLLPTLTNTGEVSDAVLEVREPGPAPAPEVQTEIWPSLVTPVPGSAIPTLTPNAGTACAGGACSC